MKKIIILTATLVLTSCTVQIGGGEPEAAPTTEAPSTTSTSTTSTTTTTLPELTDEELYLLDVDLFTDLSIWYDDYTLIEFGRTVCEYFALGGDSAGLAQIIYEAGLANGTSDDIMMDFATAAGLAVTYFCPEWSSRV